MTNDAASADPRDTAPTDRSIFAWLKMARHASYHELLDLDPGVSDASHVERAATRTRALIEASSQQAPNAEDVEEATREVLAALDDARNVLLDPRARAIYGAM